MHRAPSRGQMFTIGAVVLPLFVASGLAMGGFRNEPLSIACFVLAGLGFVFICAYGRLLSVWHRHTGLAPLTVSHVVTGKKALLTLDTGTEPSIEDVFCEVHNPNYRNVGGQPFGTAKLRGNLHPDRTTTFIVPDDFGFAPIFSQHKVVGHYQANWIVSLDHSSGPR